MPIKRPLCYFCICLCCGIMLRQLFSVFVCYCIIILLFIMSLIIIYKMRKWLSFIVPCLLFLLIGVVLFHVTEGKYSHTFKQYYSKEVVVDGYICSEIEIKDDRLQFVLQSSKIKDASSKINNASNKTNNASGRINNTSSEVSDGSNIINSANEVKGKVLISIKKADKKQYSYGNKLRINGYLQLPRPMSNPGGFDYQRYLRSLGITAIIYVDESKVTHLLGQEGWLIKDIGISVKNTLVDITNKCLDKNQAGLLSGMLIGFKDGLDDNAYNAFSTAGLTHIMVASGMNVAFIIIPLLYLFKSLRLPHKMSLILIIAVLIFFVFTAGFSASVVRAVIMGIIILISKMIYRDSDVFTSLAASAIILLIINPYYLNDVGFQLSFGSTLSIVLFYKKIKQKLSFKHCPEIVSDTLAATISAQLGVVPITLYYFNNFSTVAVISNLLVVPIVQFITIIGFIMVFAALINIDLAIMIGYINNSLLSFILYIVERSANIPYASIKIPTPTILLIVIYYLAIIYLFYADFLRNVQKKCYSGVLCVLILIFMIQVFTPKPMEITFVDVGQGDSTFIKTAKNVNVLIDGGPQKAGENSLVPFLLDKGVFSLDYVVASHGHDDHTYGLLDVLEAFSIGAVIVPDTSDEGLEKLLAMCTKKSIRVVKLKANDKINLDANTCLEVLSPKKYEGQAIEDLNNTSLVIKLVYGDFSALFTGDSGVEVEQELIRNKDLNCDVLKVAHHGSPTSSSDEFVKAVSPMFSIICVGPNKFGHPSQYVVDRLANNGATIMRTDLDGAIVIKSNGKSFNINGTIIRDK